MKRCAFVTLGCKVNQYDTEAVREEVLALGLEEVSRDAPADLYVVNTCSVTGASGSKSRRAILRLARQNPACRIVVMGCSTSRERKLLARIPQVAVLVGNREKGMVPSFIEEGLLGDGWIEERIQLSHRSREPLDREVLDLRVERFESHTRAYLKVQDGCNDFCSFCIVPHLRGRSRSRPAAPVLEEVRRLAANGYREVVVTGIHLEDYGADLSPPSSLADLLGKLASAAEEEGLWRIRLSSLGPGAFSAELVDLLKNPIFCPHLHIPIQSGDDLVLRKMRRSYGVNDFRAALTRLRKNILLPSITSDVILGHPGETEEAFQNTMDLCSEAGFSKIHVFPFSPREGTLSARLPGGVPGEEITRRARELGALGRRLALEYKRNFLGRTVEVLVEGVGAEGSVEGYTERYLRVRATNGRPGALENTICRVAVERVSPERMEGRVEGSGSGSGMGTGTGTFTGEND